MIRHSSLRGLPAAALLLVLAAPPPPAAAQTTGEVRGMVRNEAGAAVSGGEVSLPGMRRKTAIAADGSFSFAGLPAGDHLLEAFNSDFGSAVERVEVRPGEVTEVTLDLEISHIRDVVVVSAGGDSRSLLELAQPASVLEGDALGIRLQPSLGETLAQEPGINSTFFGPAASRPVIRGLGGDRVRMLSGGIGTGDVSSTSPDHAVAADGLLAERIEVLRGPSTLLYGSSAIGGVVNVLDDRIPEYRPIAKLGGYAELRGGSGADERSGVTSVEGGGGRFAWHLDLLHRETDDYEIPGFAKTEELRQEEVEEGVEPAFGTVPNSDLETESGALGLSWFFGDSGFIGVSASGYESQYGLPIEEEEEGEEGDEGEPAEEEAEEGIRLDLDQKRFDVRAESARPFGIFAGFKARVAAVEYEHRELEGTEVGTTFLRDSAEGRFELVQKRRGSLGGSVGVQASRSELEAIGEEAFIPRSDSSSFAVFGFQEIERGKLRYQLGARYESSEVETASAALPDRSFDGLSASAGVVWQPRDGYSLSASLARSVKAPNTEELFSSGAHVATQSFEVGDPDLNEESSLGIDLTARKQAGRLTGELSLFANRFDGFIFPALTGEEEDGLPVVLYSQADAEFVGAELKARYGLIESDRHHLDLEAFGDLVRAELTDDGRPLPRIPPLRYGLGLHYHGASWNGMVEVRRVDEQDRLAENETPTDGYTFLNASVGYRFVIAGTALDVMLRATNLTDEEARNHVSFLKDSVPLPGRDIGLSLRLWF